MKKVVAFADEFGNNSLDFNSQGSHFIIASVIVGKDDLTEIQNDLEIIRRKHFQTGEIKSNKVTSNHNRRIKILNELINLNFAIYAVIIDKKKLYGEGFKHKRSFYKYSNGLLYKELYRTFPQLELKVDEHGGSDFMRSFKKYVQNNHIRTLFSGSEFYIEKSNNDLGVQLADFIAGTLGFIYDESKKSKFSRKFLEILNNKIISINHFPKEYSTKNYNESDSESDYDKHIANLGLTRVFDYLDTTKGDSQDNRDRINFAKLLLHYKQSERHTKYITSNEFIKHLNVNREKEITKEQFSSKVIGHLRDKGLLIASSRDGYKLPSSANDMREFIRHGQRMVIPILRRIEECRKAILLSTNNEYDILKENEFDEIHELIKKNSMHESDSFGSSF